jgi:hypothetical protein
MQGRILELARAICRLYPKDGICANAEDTATQLRNEGFNDVSIKLIHGIHDQLLLEAEKIDKIYENSKNALFYKMTYTQERYADKWVEIWSERYVLLYDYPSDNLDFHSVEIFDLFNDKSA